MSKLREEIAALDAEADALADAAEPEGDWTGAARIVAMRRLPEEEQRRVALMEPDAAELALRAPTHLSLSGPAAGQRLCGAPRAGTVAVHYGLWRGNPPRARMCQACLAEADAVEREEASQEYVVGHGEWYERAGGKHGYDDAGERRFMGPPLDADGRVPRAAAEKAKELVPFGHEVRYVRPVVGGRARA